MLDDKHNEFLPQLEYWYQQYRTEERLMGKIDSSEHFFLTESRGLYAMLSQRDV